MESIDIVIVGAGISGIGLAVHLKKNCPNINFIILEKRTRIGGTWDLFKYPGIRSDSDMTIFGYSFKPWMKKSTLADGASILNYLNDVVDEYALKEFIQFESEVIEANFDSHLKRWKFTISDKHGDVRYIESQFFVGCTGYYDYDNPYTPLFENQNEFKGNVVHAQLWPEDLHYQNKKIVVIGSGATAISLVPALVKCGAAHVTLLQRSPTYIASVSSIDHIYERLCKLTSIKNAYDLTRIKNIAMQRGIYALAQKHPKLFRKILLINIKKKLASHIDIKHFSPTYNPWDQRLCVVPDADLFDVLNQKSASILTEKIAKFYANGIELQNGEMIDADIIVLATGLNIKILGGIQACIDHEPIKTSESMLYKGLMMSDVPNMFMMVGYINASWTLKVDIASEYLCRLIHYMQQNNYEVVEAPKQNYAETTDTIMGKLSSGYIARAADILPKQGKFKPWKMTNNYLADRRMYKNAKFDDGILRFRS